MHDIMVDFIVLQLNILKGSYVKTVQKIVKQPGEKPDIEVEMKLSKNNDFKKYFLDITFTSPELFKATYNRKVNKYKDAYPNIIPLVFGKNCTIMPTSLHHLKEMKIDEFKTKEVLALLIARHYSVCTQSLDTKLMFQYENGIYEDI
jgi:hypothetical protein